MNRRIRVIHVGDKFGKAGATVHGVTRLFSWWFTRWDSAEFDVDLVGLRDEDAAFSRLREVVPNLVTLNKGKFDPSTLPALVKIISKKKADIVHLHGYGAHNFGRIAARLTGARVVLHEHFVDPAIPLYQQVADRLLSGICDHGFAVSKSVQDFMTGPRAMPKDRVEVLYNGAPLSEFRARAHSDVVEARRNWKIPEDHLVLGSVGRLDEQKGNRYLVDAFAGLVKRGHKLRLILVGDGPLLEPLKDQCRSLGVERNIEFAGYQSNIPLFQSMFDVQVFPSLYEGTPLTLFEAMAGGRTIVSTNVDGLGEILVNDSNALVVQPRDASALEAALNRVINDPALRSRLSSKAQADAGAYDVTRMVERMQQVYTQLIG